MRFEVGRYGIDIIPENDQDEAYIEDTLGLRNNGDWLAAVRRDAMGVNCLGSVCIAKHSLSGVHPTGNLRDGCPNEAPGEG